ncbi:hypothetical protein [Lentzea californiensis]|uniref:hypothetical protein n=1 Tax=Lentzea californiensis TaxID=438851 RepID=UPI002165FDAF|nr:hypothetical protein [Lentzea californiensis]MCR3752685.1 hypothetical protein [Lentzea californiensis]
MSGHVERGAGALVVRAVTAIMAAVVGPTFLFGFGNVLSLCLRLGVPMWVAPLVAPAVDLTILGLLLGTRFLALHRASAEQLRPARRLLLFASVVTLALNVAEPMLAGAYGKAAFDAVGPLLLIGWAEVGPNLLQAIYGVQAAPAGMDTSAVLTSCGDGSRDESCGHRGDRDLQVQQVDDDELLARARRADVRHWLDHRRPVSAETLRQQLEISAERARGLVLAVRTELAQRLSASS